MKFSAFGELIDVKVDQMYPKEWDPESKQNVVFAQNTADDQEDSVNKSKTESGRGYEIAKRLLDVLLASSVLIITFPITMMIALMIKINSPGPIIFKQVRIGQNLRRRQRKNGHLYDRRNGNLRGRPFYMYKFRTMRADVDNYTWKPKRKGDPRLTFSGRIIRRLCLDELPQMLNVLKGDMSIVGPRPELPQIVQEYNALEEKRLNVKPGITGLWQLKGSRKQRIHDNIHLDLTYIRKRSFWYDIGIMFRTVKFILTFKNV